MKLFRISKLVKRLLKILDKHGDINIYFKRDYNIYEWICKVSIEKDENGNKDCVLTDGETKIKKKQ